MFTLTDIEIFYPQYDDLSKLKDSSEQDSELPPYANLNSFFQALHGKGFTQGTICIVDYDIYTYAIDVKNGGSRIIACAYLTRC